MARIGASLSRKDSILVMELFRTFKHTTVDVDQAVEQIPNTNMSHRKAVMIQNKEASGGNVLYIGSGTPYLIKGKAGEVYTDEDHDKRGLVWFPSANGTNEWFLATSARGNPSLTAVTYFYYATAGGGAETLGTNGTVSSLAAQHNWGWGNGDTLGWSTLYVRSDGVAPANSPEKKYDLLHAYYFVLTADDATTGGIELDPGETLYLPLDGSVRIFAIGSAADVDAGVLEFA